MTVGTKTATTNLPEVTLPREVLKWIQSLDLSYSVKHAKRDFANGFLIAEIFSRYYPNELSMHTFDSGTKLACRNDNWEQLFRFFRKQNIPISRAEFEPVINTVNGAAQTLLVKVYSILTRRTVPVFTVKETSAQPGASFANSVKQQETAFDTRVAVMQESFTETQVSSLKSLDVMKPIIFAILQEDEHVMKFLDPRKDLVVSFMEACKKTVPENMCVRVFDGLTNQASQLAEIMCKSPAEFWRVWTLFCPALLEFSESSPVFESVVYLFKRMGVLMGEADPVITQQLLMDVGLTSLAPLLSESAGKREHLCELVYTYTQPDILSRVAVLRALSGTIGKLPVYIACLSHFASLDLQAELLEGQLLGHYMEHAGAALHNPQPKIRVAALSVLVTVACSRSEHALRVLQLLPSFADLVHDTWWEVQAQLLLLAAQLLHQAANDEEVSSKQVDVMMNVVGQLFRETNPSKIVQQVGLCSLVRILTSYPTLLPSYVTVLLQQPAGLRQRLLANDASVPRRLAYVMGTSSRLYDECCIPEHWPAIEVAKALAEQVEASQLAHFELEHLEVFIACLPDPEVDLNDDWLAVFEKVKAYVFVALVDPALHHGAREVVRHFWLSGPQSAALRAVESSKKTLLQTLRINYSETGHARVHENLLLDFLREMRSAGGAIEEMVRSVVEQFRDVHHHEFQRSSLSALLE